MTNIDKIKDSDSTLTPYSPPPAPPSPPQTPLSRVLSQTFENKDAYTTVIKELVSHATNDTLRPIQALKKTYAPVLKELITHVTNNTLSPSEVQAKTHEIAIDQQIVRVKRHPVKKSTRNLIKDIPSFPGLQNNRAALETALKKSGQSEAAIVDDKLKTLKERFNGTKQQDKNDNLTALYSSLGDLFNAEFVEELHTDDEDIDISMYVTYAAMDAYTKEAFSALERLNQNGQISLLEPKTFTLKTPDFKTEVQNDRKTQFEITTPINPTYSIITQPFINKDGKPDLRVKIVLPAISRGTFKGCVNTIDLNQISGKVLLVTQIPFLNKLSTEDKIKDAQDIMTSIELEQHFLPMLQKVDMALRTHNIFYASFSVYNPQTKMVELHPAQFIEQEKFQGDMTSFLELDRPYEERLDVAFKMACELQNLHSPAVNVVNRDIKLENFLYKNVPLTDADGKVIEDEEGYPVPNFIPGLIDHGTAVEAKNQDVLNKSTYEGTIAFFSPERARNLFTYVEQLHGESEEKSMIDIGKPADVYAFAIALWRLLYSFSEEREVEDEEGRTKIVLALVEDYPPSCRRWIENFSGDMPSSDEILESYKEMIHPKPLSASDQKDQVKVLLNEMLNPVYAKRPTMDEVVSRLAQIRAKEIFNRTGQLPTR